MFGHRAEGFRQKDINEGQTFARKVGEQILPKFLSIYDDPTERTLGKDILIGYYPFDDEGTPSERVTLVDHGVLKNFEMSRQPLTGFPGFQRTRPAPDRRAAGFAPGKSDCRRAASP